MPLTRFAPAPTGRLHLGHVANALYVWGVARARGARVLLRVEDHDRLRSSSAWEHALLDDLDWLGLIPDIGRTDDYRQGPAPWRQSDRDAVYRRALAALERAGHRVYACDCSRKDLAGLGGGPYPGRCRDRRLSRTRGRGLRVVLEDGTEQFTDLRLGPQRQSPARQCGDLLIRDRLGNWTYQFAVVVDDAEQEVDLVVRGEDLLESTGRQLQLRRMLGQARPPEYLHHPLILKSSGEKLSKSSGDTGVADLRAAGLTPAEVIGRALFAVGLAPEAAGTSLDAALARVAAALPAAT